MTALSPGLAALLLSGAATALILWRAAAEVLHQRDTSEEMTQP